MGDNLLPFEANSLVLIIALGINFRECSGCGGIIGVQKVRWNSSSSFLDERLLCNYHKTKQKKKTPQAIFQANILITVYLSSAKPVTLHFCASGMSILLFYLSSQKFKQGQFRIKRPGAEARTVYLLHVRRQVSRRGQAGLEEKRGLTEPNQKTYSPACLLPLNQTLFPQ